MDTLTSSWIGIAIGCLPIFFTGQVISRWEGAWFLFFYVAYTAYLVLQATDSQWRATFWTAMLLFALPLSVVTLGVGLVAKSAVPAANRGQVGAAPAIPRDVRQLSSATYAFNWSESVGVAAMMNTRALMGLVAINIGRELGVVPPSVFTMLVLMAIATTLLTMPVLRRLPGLSDSLLQPAIDVGLEDTHRAARRAANSPTPE